MLDKDKDLCKTAEVEILRHMARRGYNAHLLATYSKTGYTGNELDFPVWSIPLRDAPLIRPILFAIVVYLLLPVCALLKRPRFIIVTPPFGPHTISCSLWKPVLSFCLKTKVILDIRSTPVEVEGPRGMLSSLFFNISVLLAKRVLDGITIVTEPMKEEVSRKFHLDPATIGVWTNGVSTELFDPANYTNESLQRLRKELGLLGKIVLLYHGVFTPTRGIIESVRSMSRLHHNDVILFLLGHGPALPAIESEISKTGTMERVIVHEPVAYTDVPRYIAMSDAGLVPAPNISYWANQLSLALLECLAMNKPVIVTDMPANRSVIGENDCAIYVPSTDSEEFSEAITYLRNNQKMLKQRSSRGRSIVELRYTWRAAAEALEKYLATI
jgi:glycosyltransferase involved in cell wall biosynthesis